MRCAAHPEVETNLTCSKCGKPICPRCLVQTPVGARCSECAQVKRLPTYEVTPGNYLVGAGVGLGLALAIGIAWGFLDRLLPFFYFDFLLAAGAGYAIGEVIGLAVNRKRGRGLQVVAGLSLVLSFLISNTVFFQGIIFFRFFSLFSLLALALGIFVAVTRLR